MDFPYPTARRTIHAAGESESRFLFFTVYEPPRSVAVARVATDLPPLSAASPADPAAERSLEAAPPSDRMAARAYPPASFACRLAAAFVPRTRESSRIS